jgi:acyl carrier protein
MSGIARMLENPLQFKRQGTGWRANAVLLREMRQMLDRPSLSNQVFEMVREVIQEPAPLAPIGLDDDLRRLGLTSMGMVRLMLAAEVAFDISIPDADLSPDNFRSVRAIEALVRRLMS